MNPQQIPNLTRILLTGATGQVGSALLETLAPLGELIAPTRATLDLANPSSLRKTIRTLKPRWIVNPAAYTAVDRAESEPELARAINSEALTIIGEEAYALGAAVLHFSTDYVFDGAASLTPYRETDPTGPLSVYGKTKLAGEQALAASGAQHLIIRTSWVYGATGKNFLLTILKLARERESLRIVADQHGAPTWSRDLARLAAHLIAHCEAAQHKSEVIPAELTGLYHAVSAGETTWHGFASEALRLERERHSEAQLASLEPIPTSEYPTPARRPANSRLNCSKLARNFGWTMPHWQDSLCEVLSEIEGGR